MSELAIRVEGLGKRYALGRRAEKYRTLRDTLAAAVAAPLKRLRSSSTEGAGPKPGSETFWALKDVSFAVNRGEIVGIIGRNGTGKSTLLKILSRITEPTTGYADVYGRVASLLEVGTGFHPELTGRENIYLNGSILGMRRAEIERGFDEIVAFAEVEKFIDTPVKHYSSGMYLRLAFAVAAHLVTPIVLVDEVLAVGDAAFQEKCLGKMNRVAGEGRTLLFVSHNLQALAALTHRCIVLKEGQVFYDGPTERAISLYLNDSKLGGAQGPLYRNRKGDRDNYIARAHVETSAGEGESEHLWGRALAIEFELHVGNPVSTLTFSFQVVDRMGRPVCHFWLFDRSAPFRHEQGTFRLRCEIPKFRLYMGAYTLTTWLAERRGHTMLEHLTGLCPFEVTMRGIVREEYEWVEGTCAYLEDVEWQPIERITGPGDEEAVRLLLATGDRGDSGAGPAP